MLSAIVLAAGAGKRLGGSVSKPLVKVAGRPLIAYCLKVFDKHPDIDEVIVVSRAQNKAAIAEVIAKGSFKKIKFLCLGGKRRQDSVHNGLKAVNPSSNWVLIHDCARPFIGGKLISKVILAAKKTGAAILGVSVKATIKSVKSGLVVDKTVDRSNLWEIQTPQVFKKEIILQAYRKYSRGNVTDDASLVEKLGKSVKIVPGSYENIKITTGEDLILAGLIARGSAYGI